MTELEQLKDIRDNGTLVHKYMGKFFNRDCWYYLHRHNDMSHSLSYRILQDTSPHKKGVYIHRKTKNVVKEYTILINDENNDKTYSIVSTTSIPTVDFVSDSFIEAYSYLINYQTDAATLILATSL